MSKSYSFSVKRYSLQKELVVVLQKTNMWTACIIPLAIVINSALCQVVSVTVKYYHPSLIYAARLCAISEATQEALHGKGLTLLRNNIQGWK